jgi:CRISPR locus-related DNA-binding protein
MKVLQMAIVGPEPDPVLGVVKEYPVHKMVLFYRPEMDENYHELRRFFTMLNIDVQGIELEGDGYMQLIEEVSRFMEETDHDSAVFNITGGDTLQVSAATIAAAIHGLQVITVKDGEIVQLPRMKMEMRETISEAKFRILDGLKQKDGEASSLAELSGEIGMDKSLLSYHINGGKSKPGLRDMGFIEVEKGSRGRARLSLTKMGEVSLLGKRISITG